ncbi:hypothetical protein GOV03_04285 [Candidatus Woesearchaeota archaeon]|nr:hypothetical protein [Candidatus Woesearchaeota archaeon]
MTQKFTWTIVGKDNQRTQRTIEEITKKETEGKTLLGTARDIDVSHCVFMAANQCKEYSKIQYYRICDKEEALGSGTISVEFYR